MLSNDDFEAYLQHKYVKPHDPTSCKFCVANDRYSIVAINVNRIAILCNACITYIAKYRIVNPVEVVLVCVRHNSEVHPPPVAAPAVAPATAPEVVLEAATDPAPEAG